MSISGPCVWLSSLSPPSASQLSAITSHLSTASWNSEQTPSRSGVIPTRLPWSAEKEGELVKKPSVDMQAAVLKAENAFEVAGPTVMSGGPVRYPEGEIPLKEEDRSTDSETLSRMRLDKLNHSEPHLPGTLRMVSSSVPREISPEAKRRHQEETLENDKDGDMMGTSSDDEQKQSSDAKNDKKKMKRFRLTHNQTRFLMSEFTRQAHPDAAHRERLSREIPGLTPRQVQVWFQNRRAKLKRLTSNDRERMLKSRALPDDFDTTQVLRTPFDNKTSSETPMLLTDGLTRLNDDEYVVSPLSSASTTGNGYAPPGHDRTSENFPQPSASRAAPGTLPDLHRNNRGAFPFPRSSSFSETSFNTGLHLPGRFSRPGEPPLASMSYGRRPMDYGIARPSNGMAVGYDHNRTMEGSVSPPGQQEQSMPYNVDNHNPPVQSYQSSLTMPAPKGYGGMEINSHMQPRHMPALHSVPVSDAPEYRPFAYEHHPYSMNTGMPYTQANASSMSLPASFPSDTGNVSHGPVSAEDRMNNPPQILDPLRAKYNNQPYDYTSYL